MLFAAQYDAAVANLRWGANAPEDTDAARDILIEAAAQCFSRLGVNKTTIEDVANDANVSRATVYRYFKDRDDLVLGVMLRQAEGHLKRMRTEIAKASTPGQALTEFIVLTARRSKIDPHIEMLFSTNLAGFSTRVAGASTALFSLITDFVRPVIEDAERDGLLRDGVTVDGAGEWTLRTILSMMSVDGPHGRSEKRIRELTETYFVPALFNT